METLLKWGEFFRSLTLRGWFGLVGGIVLAGFCLEVYRIDNDNKTLKIENAQLRTDIAICNNGRNTDILNMAKAIDSCNQRNIKEVQKIQDYFRKRVEYLEERAAREYRKIKGR